MHASVFFSLHRDHPALTTEQLCATVIKPATAPLQCAYMALLQEKASTPSSSPTADPLIAPATCFISHAWKCSFGDIADSVQQYEQKHPGTYYWFDLFMNNQHKATSNPFEWWCTTFKESIRSIGKVMLVMAPWDNPVPLTRAWCLFEMYTTMKLRGCEMLHLLTPGME